MTTVYSKTENIKDTTNTSKNILHKSSVEIEKKNMKIENKSNGMDYSRRFGRQFSDPTGYQPWHTMGPGYPAAAWSWGPAYYDGFPAPNPFAWMARPANCHQPMVQIQKRPTAERHAREHHCADGNQRRRAAWREFLKQQVDADDQKASHEQMRDAFKEFSGQQTSHPQPEDFQQGHRCGGWKRRAAWRAFMQQHCGDGPEQRGQSWRAMKAEFREFLRKQSDSTNDESDGCQSGADEEKARRMKRREAWKQFMQQNAAGYDDGCQNRREMRAAFREFMKQQNSQHGDASTDGGETRDGKKSVESCRKGGPWRRFLMQQAGIESDDQWRELRAAFFEFCKTESPAAHEGNMPKGCAKRRKMWMKFLDERQKCDTAGECATSNENRWTEWQKFRREQMGKGCKLEAGCPQGQRRGLWKEFSDMYDGASEVEDNQGRKCNFGQRKAAWREFLTQKGMLPKREALWTEFLSQYETDEDSGSEDSKQFRCHRRRAWRQFLNDKGLVREHNHSPWRRQMKDEDQKSGDEFPVCKATGRGQRRQMWQRFLKEQGLMSGDESDGAVMKPCKERRALWKEFMGQYRATSGDESATDEKRVRFHETVKSEDGDTDCDARGEKETCPGRKRAMWKKAMGRGCGHTMKGRCPENKRNMWREYLASQEMSSDNDQSACGVSSDDEVTKQMRIARRRLRQHFLKENVAISEDEDDMPKKRCERRKMWRQFLQEQGLSSDDDSKQKGCQQRKLWRQFLQEKGLISEDGQRACLRGQRRALWTEFMQTQHCHSGAEDQVDPAKGQNKKRQNNKPAAAVTSGDESDHQENGERRQRGMWRRMRNHSPAESMTSEHAQYPGHYHSHGHPQYPLGHPWMYWSFNGMNQQPRGQFPWGYEAQY